MSEKMYAWLLRLYPSHFRAKYGDEALQLFRDRKRDEPGFVGRLRLWLDLLADLAVSLPRLHRYPQPAFAAASVPLVRGPSFYVFEARRIAAAVLVFASALSLGVFDACSYLIAHPGDPTPSSPSSTLSLAAAADPSPVQRPAPIEASHASAPAAIEKLDASERRRVVDAAITNLKRYYAEPDVAQRMADALRKHQQAGDYDAAPDGAAFSDLLTRQLRTASHDLHLEVRYSERPLPDRPQSAAPQNLAVVRRAMEQQNCTFEPVKILSHNVGYLKLNSFPDPSVCLSTATATMSALNHTDAVIFDLRDNRGGFPAMVMLLAAYLFDHPEYMYNPRENTTERLWTHSPVPGSRLADKPVYILTSTRTLSAAEHFSYDLKMLRRATLVGERTGGATDVGVFHRLDDHFGMGIRETKPVNPFAEPDWAARGVQPNVQVRAADALQTAERLAASKFAKK